MDGLPSRVLRAFQGLLFGTAVLTAPLALTAQETGVVQGRVIRSDDSSTVRGVTVVLVGTAIYAVTDANGQYELPAVPAGRRRLMFRWLGFQRVERSLDVLPNGRHTVDVALEPAPLQLSEIVVTGAARAPQRLVEAPAAIAVVDNQAGRDVNIGGQAPHALANLPGVDIAQNGMFDYNVNTRGFNTTLNRRVLVLQDGRDLAFAFLGSQEWSALSLPLEDRAAVEFVRGPGSALYGANAYSGVLNITTPTAREVVGTRLSAVGGELATFRADLRHANVFGNRRFGYRINAGYYRSDSWSLSRTSPIDFAREYAPAVDTTQHPVSTPFPGFELRPLNGQSQPGGPGTPATGEPDPIVNIHGTGRLDYYAPGGGIFTVEGGAARVENEVGLTGVGRVQVDKAVRPWARVAWTSFDTHLSAWYSGRQSIDPRWSLLAGTPQETVSHIAHVEAQHNRLFADGRGRVVFGASARNTYVDSKGTIMLPVNDGRNDWYYSAYGQVEMDLTPTLQLVGAARFDGGDLFADQISPKAALVVQPTERHSLRLTFNRAFQTPNIVEYFLAVPFGPPADFSALEAGLRASPLGPLLTAVPDGELFTTSSSVPVLALGNETLSVEHVTSLEVGYKGQLGERLFLTIDAYYSRLSDLVTDLLPAVNPAFSQWTAPAVLSEDVAAVVEQAVSDALGAAGQAVAAAGLTRLEDGSTAVVVSVGNAGKADEFGVEMGSAVRLSDEVTLEANYSYFTFDLDSTSLVAGDQVLPNTPRHKGNLVLNYAGLQGVDARVSARIVEGYDWASGIYVGHIPASQTIDLSGGYQLNDQIRFQFAATNILNQLRYHAYGGAVIGRRILAGLTFTF